MRAQNKAIKQTILCLLFSFVFAPFRKLDHLLPPSLRDSAICETLKTRTRDLNLNLTWLHAITYKN